MLFFYDIALGAIVQVVQCSSISQELTEWH